MKKYLSIIAFAFAGLAALAQYGPYTTNPAQSILGPNPSMPRMMFYFPAMTNNNGAGIDTSGNLTCSNIFVNGTTGINGVNTPTLWSGVANISGNVNAQALLLQGPPGSVLNVYEGSFLMLSDDGNGNFNETANHNFKSTANFAQTATFNSNAVFNGAVSFSTNTLFGNGVGIYTGTIAPPTFAAANGSLFIATTGALYVRTNSAWLQH